ncbi:MAG TPA: type II toxin-antitoxin system ParD family antitoxin [Croceibacterium sp.]|nr:type II toxin-antitoxin system ParD family antitoxin [Croceibacterium sp.]
MAKNTSIALSDRHIAYAHRKIESGEFSSVSEVVRDALRRAEERDARVERLRELIGEGEESGTAEGFDFDKFLAEQFPDA